MRILFAILILFFSTSAWADGFSMQYRDFSIRYTLENSDSIFDRKGQIEVRNSEGKLVYLSRSAYSPGCDKGFPAISTLDFGVGAKKTYIVFCGTAGGKTNLIRFYDPYIGMVGAILFNNSPNFREIEPGVFEAVTHIKGSANWKTSPITSGDFIAKKYRILFDSSIKSLVIQEYQE